MKRVMDRKGLSHELVNATAPFISDNTKKQFTDSKKHDTFIVSKN